MAGSLNRVCIRYPDTQRAVHTLEVRLGYAPSHLGSVRDLIAHAIHVFSLTILISTRAPPSLLPSRGFKNLTTFTTNLPHSYLADFITRSPQLRCLSLLSDCRGFSECPLQNAVALSLDEIHCGSIACIGSFHHSTAVGTIRLLTPEVDGETCDIPYAALPMSSSIVNLRLPFSGTEIPSLIPKLLRSAPAVETLALEEYRGAFHLDHMPFSYHHHVFASDLSRLRKLRALHLKLLSRVGLPADDETSITKRWVNSCQESQSLRFLLVWSDTLGQAQGRVRIWFRTGRGAWTLAIDRAGRSNEPWETSLAYSSDILRLDSK
ncbi:unnamed protein product [Peniophora sp. CBMAI 1063]|nr:unnamed protein product [Peniophora sp. CBMAI 1063]